MFSLQGIKLISENLREAYTNGNNIEAREKMLLAAFYGGVAISCSSTVAVHALSYPLGGRYRIPHGVSNAILLPYVMKYNMGSIGEKATSIAKAMCIDTSNLSQEQIGAKVVEEIFRLTEDLNIPSNLKHFGINSADITLLANSASQVTRLLDQNPKKMSLDDITAIYGQVL
jgi:alcohol dehydrogenase class IV